MARAGSSIRRIGPVRRCPQHHVELDGGPVQFHCPVGDGHRVQAADIDHEVPRAVA